MPEIEETFLKSPEQGRRESMQLTPTADTDEQTIVSMVSDVQSNPTVRLHQHYRAAKP